jgi:hypothetical protein
LLNFLNDKAIRSSIITAVITLWRTQPDLKLQEQIYPLVVDALQGDSERNNAVKQINLLMKLLTPEECLRFLEAIFVLKNINDIIAEDNIQDLCVKLLLKMSGASCFLNMFQQFKNLLLVREEPLSVDYHRVATIIFAVPHLITQRHQYIVELRPLIQSEDTEIQAIAIASITQLISGPGLELQQQRREMLALLKPFLDHENLALRTSAVLATADLFASMPRRTIDRAPRLQESNARDTSILPSVKDNNSFIFSHRAQTGGEVTQTQKEKENTKDHRPH